MEEGIENKNLAFRDASIGAAAIDEKPSVGTKQYQTVQKSSP